MTKLYRTGRAYLGWAADALLAAIIVGAWFVAGTIALAALHAMAPDAERLPVGAALFASLALVVWFGIRFVRSEAFEDGWAEAYSDLHPAFAPQISDDEIPF
jgi:hypothetical protein